LTTVEIKGRDGPAYLQPHHERPWNTRRRPRSSVGSRAQTSNTVPGDACRAIFTQLLPMPSFHLRNKLTACFSPLQSRFQPTLISVAPSSCGPRRIINSNSLRRLRRGWCDPNRDYAGCDQQRTELDLSVLTSIRIIQADRNRRSLILIRAEQEHFLCTGRVYPYLSGYGQIACSGNRLSPFETSWPALGLKQKELMKSRL
jgi:hypothetical protein